MIVTLDGKRRVSIPRALAPTEPGDRFEATFDAEEDAVILRRIQRKARWLDVWKQCPVPMDDLPPRSTKPGNPGSQGVQSFQRTPNVLRIPSALSEFESHIPQSITELAERALLVGLVPRYKRDAEAKIIPRVVPGDG